MRRRGGGLILLGLGLVMVVTGGVASATHMASSFDVTGRVIARQGAGRLALAFSPVPSTCPRPPAHGHVVHGARADLAPQRLSIGADGRYRVELAAETVWRMEVRTPSGLRFSRGLAPLFAPERMPPLIIHGGTTRVRIEDPSGRPLASARFRTAPLDLAFGYRMEPLSFRTDAGGWATLALSQEIVARLDLVGYETQARVVADSTWILRAGPDSERADNAANAPDEIPSSVDRTTVLRVRGEAEPLAHALAWASNDPSCWGYANAAGEIELVRRWPMEPRAWSVEAAGYARRSVLAGSEAGGFGVDLERATGILTDAVQDVRNRPIEDARIEIESLGRVGWSDAKGRVVFPNLGGVGRVHTVERSKPNFFPRSGTRVVVAADERPDAIHAKVMFQPCEVVGKVVDREGRVPTGPIRAVLTEQPAIDAWLDEEGRFRLAGVSHEAQIVVFELAGDSVGMVPIKTAGDGARVDLGTIRLQPTARVSGQVLDEAGHSVPGVEIGVKLSAGENNNHPISNEGTSTLPTLDVTDEAGLFAIEGLPFGARVALGAVRPGHAPRQRLLTLNEIETTVSFTMPTLLPLTIRVVSAVGDTPLSDAAVFVDPGQTPALNDDFTRTSIVLPNDDGEAHVDVLPGTEGQVQVRADGYVDQTKAIRYDDHAPLEPLVFRLVPEAILSGVVRDPDGVPLSGVRIGIAVGDKGPHFGWAPTNAEGWFEAGGLAHGPATLILKAPKFGAQRRTIELPAGERTEVDLQLTPVPGYRLMGQVVLEESGPVGGVQIEAVERGTSIGYSAVTDGHGWFALDALPEGDYLFRVRGGREPLALVDPSSIHLAADVLDMSIVVRRVESP